MNWEIQDGSAAVQITCMNCALKCKAEMDCSSLMNETGGFYLAPADVWLEGNTVPVEGNLTLFFCQGFKEAMARRDFRSHEYP